MPATVHIIGAGVSGLSAAVHLVSRGIKVLIHESAGHAGGRCRSYFDAKLGRQIDNGNHLLLSGNRSVHEYLKMTDAVDQLTDPGKAVFPFLDLETKTRWNVEPDEGIIPWSLFSAANRVPGSRGRDYFKALKLKFAGPDTTVKQCLGPDGVLYHRLWEPLAVSILNTEAETAAASLLWPVLQETFGRGGKACRPLIARIGLSETFVDPALAFIRAAGGEISLNHRLRSFQFESSHVKSLEFNTGTIELSPEDRVILAVPAGAASTLVPDQHYPTESRAIINAHFVLPEEYTFEGCLGIVGGLSHWLFVRGDVASITISAADSLLGMGTQELEQKLWSEVTQALEISQMPCGPSRVIREKKATFAQTPEQLRKRPGLTSSWDNLLFAGDWVNTGLPATIEGAIRSGKLASNLI